MSDQGKTITRRRGSVVIDNNTVYDQEISYTALGVLAVLLARPDDAPKGYRSLMRPAAGVGQSSILSAFKELRAAGYRYQFLRSITNARGRNRVVTDTYISETPISLEEAKRWHFDTTGQVAKDTPDRSASKVTLASVSDAHDRDAHDRDAHDPGAQETGKASVLLSGVEKTPPQINQGETPAADATDAPAAVQDVGPSLPATRGRDDAAPMPARGPGYDAYLKFKEATRETVVANTGLSPKAIKEVAPLRPNTGAGA